MGGTKFFLPVGWQKYLLFKNPRKCSSGRNLRKALTKFVAFFFLPTVPISSLVDP